MATDDLVLHRGLDKGKCRSCGAAIVWCLTINGKKSPFVADEKGFFVLENGYAVHKGAPPTQLELGAPTPPQRYTSHFANCAQASEWRKPR
jgi:hypothetical protein